MNAQPDWVHDDLPTITADQENFEYYDFDADELKLIPIEWTVKDEFNRGVIIDCEYDINGDIDVQCLEDQIREFKFSMEYNSIYDLTFSQKI